MDRIEVYVDEQKAQDESLYNEAMEKVSASGSVSDVGLLGMQSESVLPLLACKIFECYVVSV